MNRFAPPALLALVAVTALLVPACSKASEQPAAAPAATPAGSAGDVESKVPGPRVQRGQTYRHPIGFSFWHPADWVVSESDDGLQLIPTDTKKNAQGPREIYLVIADSAAGIGRPDDPRVVSYFDQALRQIAPWLRKTGKPVAVANSSGPGVALDWTGKNPAGAEVLARAYVTLLQGYGVALVALGERPLIEARDPIARSIFGSFGLERGKQDPALAGRWSLLSTVAITNNSVFETAWSRAKMVNEQTSTLVLQADGSWTRQDTRHLLAGAGGLWIEDKSSSSASGTWRVGGDKLYMIWKNGTWEEYRYELRGNQLRLIAGGTGEIWKRN